jgi:hypothetical protein
VGKDMPPLPSVHLRRGGVREDSVWFVGSILQCGAAAPMGKSDADEAGGEE